MNTLYVSDLDGTLLTSRATLSEFSRDTLRQLLKEGIRFSVASARSVVSIREMLRGLPISLPIVEFNGAFLTDMETGRHEVVNSIEPALAEEIYRSITRSGCVPLMATFDGVEDRLYCCEGSNEGVSWYMADRVANRDRRLRMTENLRDHLREQVVCFTIIGPGGILAEVETLLGEAYGPWVTTHLSENLYSPGWYWLTVYDRRATKDQAVRILMDRYGLTESELIAFGDHLNDIRMFQIARHGVAVANASPELKRYATHIIGPNEEDSVVKYIREHWDRRIRPTC